MAEIWSRRGVWTRQPQKLVQIDWSNSLSRGLVAWWTPFTNPGGIYAPLVGNPNGLGLKTSTARTSEYAESQQYFADFTPTQGVTLAALVKPNIGASNYERLISFKASTRAYALQLFNANKLQVVGTDSVDTNRYTDYTLTTAQATDFHLYSSVSTAGSAVDPAYVDGVKLTGGVVGVAGNGVYQQISPAKLQIARLYSNNQWNYGRHDWIGLGLAWDRALTDAEHAELARDPWQLFAPQRQVSYFLPPPPSALEITPQMQRMPRVWTRQPQGGAGANPDFRLAFLVNAATGTRNLGTQPATSDWTQPLAGTSSGVGWVGTNNTTTNTRIKTTGTLPTYNEHTYVLFFQVDGAPVSYGSYLTGDTFSLASYNATSIDFSENGLTGTFSVTTGKPSCIVISRGHSAEWKTVDPIWFQDGKPGPARLSDGTNISTNTTITAGNHPTLPRGFNGKLLLAAFLPELVSAEQARSLSLNPWQLFAPQRTVTYSLPTAPSAVQTKTVMQTSKQIWTRQPQGLVQINWNNALTRGLVSSLELTRNAMRDYVSSLTFNHTRPIVGTTQGRAASFDGTGLINTGVTSIGGQSLFATASNPFTVSLLVRRTASNTYFSKASANSLTRTFQIGEGGGVGDATPFVGIRGAFVNTNLGYSDSNWHLYTVAFNGTSATLFVDGTASAALTVGTAAEETTETLTIGGRTASAPGSLFSGNVAFVRIWSRALSQSEHRALYANPWQLFAPQQQIIYSLASVKPSLSAPAATSITNTTATPQVTLNL